MKIFYDSDRGRETLSRQLSATLIKKFYLNNLSGHSGRTTAILTSVLLIAILLSEGCSDGQKEPFNVGVGVVNITPPVGYPHYQGISTGVRDSLYAKALAFNQGGQQGVLLICNVIGIPRDLSRIVRERASKETGIPYQYISITATHNHTGPSFNDPLQAYADHEAAGKLTDEDRNGYIGFLIDGMVKSIVIALKNMQPAVMNSGIGHAEGISFNRRYLMTDGRVVMNPGHMNPKIVRPAGPIDPDVHFVLFRPEGMEEYNASLTVFASHYARGIYEFSSDYPFYLGEKLKEFYGKQVVSVFGSGTCGDINTVDVSRQNAEPDGTPAGVEWVSIVGNMVADAIRDALPAASKGTPGFKIASSTIHLPLQDFTSEELEWAMGDPKDTLVLYPDRRWLIRFRRGKILSLAKLHQREAVAPAVAGQPWTLPVEIHAFRLDDRTAIITMPGEIFVEHGLAIKERSPFSNTLVIELANASIGYVPTVRSFSQGDYEAINSRLAPGSGEKMVDEAVRMLNELNN